MPNQNIIQKLRKKIIGNDDSKALEKIDDIINSISDNLINKDIGNHIDLIKSISKEALGDKSLLQNIEREFLSTDMVKSRAYRYSTSDEITDNLPPCARALKVLSDGILSPDDITKKSIQVLYDSEINDSDTEQELSQIKSLSKALDIDRLLYYTITDTLKYGDQFLEICDTADESIPLTSLTEVATVFEEGKEDKTEKVSLVFENFKSEEKDKNILEEASSNNNMNINNVFIIDHKPETVIKLKSEKHKLCLGYIIIPDSKLSDQNSSPNSSSGGKNFVSKLISTYSSSSGSNSKNIDDIYKKVFEKIKTINLSNINMSDKNIKINKKELKDILNRVMSSVELEDESFGESQKKIKIRFVPDERMVHFRINEKKFYPYGESIFQKSIFHAKLLIALESAATIKRLTNSTEKQIVYYESGMSRDEKSIVEGIKNQLTKRTHSVDSLGSVASIPSIAQTYHTMYIPTVRGKRLIEFDTLQQSPEMRGVVDELKLFRDFLVSTLDVPPPYINIEENLSNKNSLAFENAVFAETIIGYQYILNPQLRELFDKLSLFIYRKKISDNIIITFPQPRALQLERESERIDYSSRIIQALADIGVPKEWSKLKYLDLPWKEIDNFKTKKQMDDKTTLSKSDEQETTGLG